MLPMFSDLVRPAARLSLPHCSLASHSPCPVPQVQSGVVAYHEFRETAASTRPPQLQIYDICLQLYGARHKWMLFTDADEFVILKQQPDLPSFMRGYEGHAALVMNWQVCLAYAAATAAAAAAVSVARPAAAVGLLAQLPSMLGCRHTGMCELVCKHSTATRRHTSALRHAGHEAADRQTLCCARVLHTRIVC